ncbi:hypothetical protein GW17_00009008 [Ensete ventricosum]|nr:hypothetical protein GW17_00009008 [Ensete ventricosum]RZR84327.1 hypothetical protein BHM03_00011124 [Ensete ventricosum]
MPTIDLIRRGCASDRVEGPISFTGLAFIPIEPTPKVRTIDLIRRGCASDRVEDPVSFPGLGVRFYTYRTNSKGA